MDHDDRNATGYGPRRTTGGRWQRLVFDGDEENYELWEVKFLGHMRLEGLTQYFPLEMLTQRRMRNVMPS